MLGVIEIFAAAKHIDGFVFTRPRDVLQSLVLLIIRDEICISEKITILGVSCLGPHRVGPRSFDLTLIEAVSWGCLL